MKSKTVLLFIAFLAATLNGFIAGSARGDGIRFDQIPASAESYFYADADRFAASHLAEQLGASKDIEAQMQAQFGGHIASGVIYSLAAGKVVVLIHGETKALERAQAMVDDKDFIVLNYEQQAIHCSPISSTIKAALGISSSGDKVTDSGAQPSNRGGSFTLGLGGLGVGSKYVADDLYTALVRPDMLVGTTDPRTMAVAVDALHGKTPSLAQSDPHNLKGDVPPGAMFCGSGLTANLQGVNVDAPIDTAPGSATQPAGSAAPASGNFGLSLFGSFKGKAKLARFDMGEDEQNVYVHASFTMVDADSAEQLKNLMIGIKALISLSQTDQGPLLNPLEIKAGEKNVALQWDWPLEKLRELIRLMHAHSDHDSVVHPPIVRPDTAGSTQPTP